MKFLVLFFLLASCASTSSNPSKSSPLQVEYSEHYKRLEAQLNAQVPQCLKHTKEILVRPVIEKQISKDKYEFQFINPHVRNAAIQAYEPANFDWQAKGLLKNLYLSYPYDEAISQEHYENSNEITACANDFDHLNFITAIINSWSKDPKNAALYQQVFRKYFTYVHNNDTPLIALLTLDHIVLLMHEKGLVKIKDAEAYKKASLEMEQLYTQTGRNVLVNFKEKDFKAIYKLDKKLLEGQQKFKRLIFEQISL